MKIATSPFVYWGVAVFMPEKLGNLQAKQVKTSSEARQMLAVPPTQTGDALDADILVESSP